MVFIPFHTCITEKYIITTAQILLPIISLLLLLNTPSFIFGFRDKRDKTMADKLMYKPNDDTQNYLFCRLQLVVETFGHLTN